MIQTLIKQIQHYAFLYEQLVKIYPGILPEDFYVNARKAVYENAPYKTEQLFKILNLLAGNLEFPETGLTYESMLEELASKKDRIEELIEEARERKDIVSTYPSLTIHQLVLIALFQIKSTAEIAESYYDTAKTTHDSQLL